MSRDTHDQSMFLRQVINSKKTPNRKINQCLADLTQAFETKQKELVLILSVIYFDLNKHVTCLSDRAVNYVRTSNINDILFNKIGHKLNCIFTSPLFGITQYKVIITKSNKKSELLEL